MLPAEVLSGREALLIPKTDDGRVLFAIPWLGSVLVGTTDEEVNSFDDVHLRADEVDYLLRHLNRYLATPVSASRIVVAWPASAAVDFGQGEKYEQVGA